MALGDDALACTSSGDPSVRHAETVSYREKMPCDGIAAKVMFRARLAKDETETFGFMIVYHHILTHKSTTCSYPHFLLSQSQSPAFLTVFPCSYPQTNDQYP